jgi:protein SCO1/2
MNWRRLAVVATLVALSGVPAPARAESKLGAKALQTIRFDQRIGAELSSKLRFRDERGRDVALGDYFGKRPLVLALVYNSCPMLCNQVLTGAVSAMRVLELEPGKDYDLLAVSFDPKERFETAAKQKDKYLRFYAGGKSPSETAVNGVHFLTGDAEPIAALTAAVGFRYEYDSGLGQYAHAAGLVVLTPEGRVSRYFFGTEYSPRDLRLGLVQASGGKLGTLTDELMLLCYRYDPASGSYSASAIGAIRIGGAMTALALAGFIGVSVRREKRREQLKKEKAA